MARFCDLSGKGPMSGNSVSHSNIKTKRKFYPNLQKKTFFIPELDRWIELKVSSSFTPSTPVAFCFPLEELGTV